MPKPKAPKTDSRPAVLVEVEGGCAYAYYDKRRIRVVLVDLDNMRDGRVSSDEIKEMLAEVATLQVAVKRGVLICHVRDALVNAEEREKEAK